ncbi:hypothetical protein JYT26_02525, partial [Beggiatoa alba]|nr:hypothetical protein [Beggiatoa alba]
MGVKSRISEIGGLIGRTSGVSEGPQRVNSVGSGQPQDVQFVTSYAGTRWNSVLFKFMAMLMAKCFTR